MNCLVNHHLNLMPALYVDQLYYPRGTLLMLNDHRDFYPFDQIFYQLVFGVYFRHPFGVVDPILKEKLINILVKMQF